MKYTIEKMDITIPYVDENKKTSSLTGYSFLDENNRCFIITWGERKRDLIKNYLNG
ncbi:MAG: hypothetical protein ACOC33_02745 [bacterium]